MKCAPGVICINNSTLFLIGIIALGILVYYTVRNPNVIIIKEKSSKHTNNTNLSSKKERNMGLFPSPSYSFSNISNDVLLNPYSAPFKENQFLPNRINIPSNAIPININTRGIDTNFKQLGILTRLSGPETILPLMGRPIYSNRDKWQFYTMSDKNPHIKLPVSNKGKSCTSEYGCDDIFSGDTVYVEGYNDAFKATIYDSNYPQYIPFV